MVPSTPVYCAGIISPVCRPITPRVRTCSRHATGEGIEPILDNVTTRASLSSEFEHQKSNAIWYGFQIVDKFQELTTVPESMS